MQQVVGAGLAQILHEHRLHSLALKNLPSCATSCTQVTSTAESPLNNVFSSSAEFEGMREVDTSSAMICLSPLCSIL